MICPKCASDTLYEERDAVVCSNCGFRTTLLEYNAWKRIERAKPPRNEERVFRANKILDPETSETNVDPWRDRRYQILIILIVLTILFLIL